MIFKDIRYDDGLNKNSIGQISQLEETSHIIMTTSTENKNSLTGLVEGTEILWMCMRRCCMLLYRVYLALWITIGQNCST